MASGALACLAGTPASADSLAPGDERFKFVAGWFLPAFNTDVRIDDTDNVGDDVNLGDDLGMDEDQSGALLGFEWRIAERHRLGASWSSFSQNATRVIDEQMTIGDEVYPIDAEVRTEVVARPDPDHLFLFLHQARKGRVRRDVRHPPGQGLDSTARRDLSDRRGTGPGVGSFGGLAVAAPRPALRPPFLGFLVGRLNASYFSASNSAKARWMRRAPCTTCGHTGYRFQGRYGAGIAIDAFNLDLDATRPLYGRATSTTTGARSST